MADTPTAFADYVKARRGGDLPPAAAGGTPGNGAGAGERRTGAGRARAGSARPATRAGSARPATRATSARQGKNTFGSAHAAPPYWPLHTGGSKQATGAPALQFPRPRSAMHQRSRSPSPLQEYSSGTTAFTREPLAVNAAAIAGAARRIASASDPHKALADNPAMAKQFIDFADSLRGALPPRPASAAAFSAASDGPPPPTPPILEPPPVPAAARRRTPPPTPPSGNLAMPPPPAAVPTVEDFVRAERPVGSHLRSFSQGANPMQGTPREEKTGGGRVADAMQVVRPPSRGGVPPSDSGGVPGRNERGQYEPPVSGKKSTRYVREQELELDPNDRPKPSEPEGSWNILVPSGYDRWRMSMKDRNGKLIDESVLHTIAFNGLITALKDKIYQKGPFAVTNHFQALDLDGSGSLDPHEFFKALETMNLGPGLNQQVSDMLLRAVDKDASGTIDYVEFTDAIRMGRVDYIKPPLKARCGPDPDMPFGDIKQRMPWGVMKDADRNLEAFDKKINSMFRDLESVFERFDTDGSGEIDYNEFTHAMRELNRKKGLNISEEEIMRIFKVADHDRSGTISYEEFVKNFSGAGGRRFIPEFLKPKSVRSTLAGPIWDHGQAHPFTNPNMFERKSIKARYAQKRVDEFSHPPVKF